MNFLEKVEKAQTKAKLLKEQRKELIKSIKEEVNDSYYHYVKENPIRHAICLYMVNLLKNIPCVDYQIT